MRVGRFSDWFAPALFLLVIASCSPAFGNEIKLLNGSGDQLLHDYLLGVMREQYAERRRDFEASLDSHKAAEARRVRQREQFLAMLGEFPERTPLNGRVVGTLDADGYRVERVIYESRPNHHVTALLFLPEGDGPFPGVLVPCGHSHEGKALPTYQAACMQLVKQGLAVLIYDPIGQGERLQMLELSRHGTTEHTLVHVGAVLVGRSTGHYRTWDGIRSLDYLAERPEVDASRLGVTGNSGGGTMTTWIAAIDERVVAAAPSCFISTQQGIFESIGSQDGEQQFPRQGAYGIEHADFLMMRAPRPTKILSAERDFFPIAGSRQSYDELKRFFAVYGHEERVAMATYDAPHGWHMPLRHAAASWMRRWLLDDERGELIEPGEYVEEALTDDDAQVTESGQVLREFADEITVQQMNLDRAQELHGLREQFWSAGDETSRLAKVRELLGMHHMNHESQVEKRGETEYDGYRIEHWLLTRDEFPLPALLYVPDELDERPPAVVIDSQGKSASKRTVDEFVLPRVRQGRMVLIVDLRGYGETRDGEMKYQNDEFRTGMLAMHIGQPLLGQRVADTLAALKTLLADVRVLRQKVELVGLNQAAPIALHAAYLDDHVTEVDLHGGITSWVEDVVAQPAEPNLMGHMVPDVLRYYDLPDLVRKLRQRVK